MSFKVFDRVRQTTTTIGTGDVTLSYPPSGSYVAFRQAFNNGDQVPYVITDSTNAFEIGIGIFNLSDSPYADTLSRSQVLSTSNFTSDNINFGIGNKDVFVSAPASLTPILSSLPSGGITTQVVTYGAYGDSSFTLSNLADITISSNTQLIFNDSGTLVGSPNCIFDKSTNTFTLAGHFQAYDKAFFIPHPIKPNYNLVHGSLEGPEHGIYLRGRVDQKGSRVFVHLPEYFRALVGTNYTVNISSLNTNILFVNSISDLGFEIVKHWSPFKPKLISFYYTVIGERMPLVVEQPKGAD